MATPSTSGPISSSPSAPRWGRSGEPGSAFNGLTRPGRGRGRGGNRGARGGSSRGGDPRPSKPNDDKPDTKQPAPTTVAAPDSEKAQAPASSTSKPKSSRRASRASPAVINTQIQASDVPTAPASARPSNRRRSHVGKPPLPAKINPPALGDNLVRPNKPRIGQVPHTAPIKDTPPHINQKLDIRNDIDALVERVRAVAMDHRPSTPGSHIDWAGDDDDSLPDLDDWGITPATFTANKLDVISPIIVDGLKPLPDIINNSVPSSPAQPAQTSASSPVKAKSPLVHEQRKEASFSARSPHVPASSTIEKGPPNAAKEAPSEQTVYNATSDTLHRRPLHPSLPVKPVTTSPVNPLNSRSGATPMRSSPYPKSPIRTYPDLKDGKGRVEQSELEPAKSDNKQDSQQKGKSASVEQAQAENPNPDQKPSSIETPSTAPDSLTIKVVSPGAKDSDSSRDVFKNLDGLGASIHAPKALSDSLSAPATVSSYTDVSLHAPHKQTHTRAHTVGRPAFNKYSPTEHTSRFTRSGQSTPRDGSEGSYHSRTRSSPPISMTGGPNPRPHNNTRPVITGDAISRLARTIGKPKASSKPQTVTSSAD